jgi:hypothetical protein
MSATFHMATSPDLKERLRVLARADGRTLAGYINKVLADHVALKGETAKPKNDLPVERVRFKAKCDPPPEPVWNYPQMPNTQEVGWYATLYCWDGSEGIFAGGSGWLGDRWAHKLPVYAWAGPFSTMVEADEWAKAHNPEDM